MRVRILKVKDNQLKKKDAFSEIANLTSKIADKTLEQLEREGIFVFPELVKDWMIQLPRNIHGAASGMLNVVCRSQECVGCCTYQIGFEFPNEQQHLTAALPVVNITLSNGTGIRGCALALPMEQTLVDGIIVVHGGRRIVFV